MRFVCGLKRSQLPATFLDNPKKSNQICVDEDFSLLSKYYENNIQFYYELFIYNQKYFKINVELNGECEHLNFITIINIY